MLPQIAKRRSCRCINYKQYTNNYTLDIEVENGSASNRSKAILGLGVFKQGTASYVTPGASGMGLDVNAVLSSVPPHPGLH